MNKSKKQNREHSKNYLKTFQVRTLSFYFITDLMPVRKLVNHILFCYILDFSCSVVNYGYLHKHNFGLTLCLSCLCLVKGVGLGNTGGYEIVCHCPLYAILKESKLRLSAASLSASSRWFCCLELLDLQGEWHHHNYLLL